MFVCLTLKLGHLMGGLTMPKIFQVERIFKNTDLTPAEKKLLTDILEDPLAVQQNGIRTLAKHHFTSPSAIERLAKRLGFSGYSEMIYHAKKQDTETSVINETTLSHLSNVNHTILRSRLQKYLTPETCIYLYGEGFNTFISGYFYRKLLVNHYDATQLNGLDIPFVYTGERPLTLIILSRSGENFACLQKIDQAKQANGHVISFTANISSTVAKRSDLPIEIRDGRPDDSANVEYTTFYGDTLNAFEQLIVLANRVQSEA